VNREEVIRAAHAMCLALGGHSGRRSVQLMITRVLGYSFRDAEVGKALSIIRGHHYGHHSGTTAGTTSDAQNGGLGTMHGTNPAPAEAPLNGPLSPRAPLSPLNPPIVVSNDTTRVECEQETAKRVREQKLPFDRPLLDARYAIMRAVWRQVEPIIGRSTTWANWRARNTHIATALASGGFTPEQVLRAWELASKDAHEPVRELSRVQRYLERVEAAIAARKGQT